MAGAMATTPTERHAAARRVLVTAPGSRALVREFATTAWAVLVDVALDAKVDDGQRVARTSARLIASHLGLTPGTVARALARLCAAGLVRRRDRRDEVTRPLCRIGLRPRPDGGHRAVYRFPAHGEAEHGREAPSRRRRPSRRSGSRQPDRTPFLFTPLAPTSQPAPATFPLTPCPSSPRPSTTSPAVPPSTPQRPTDSCHPSGRALPGAAPFSREAGS
ncbi:MAG: helix-turn-helix domain-containing protein [Gaiellales bacterium]